MMVAAAVAVRLRFRSLFYWVPFSPMPLENNGYVDVSTVVGGTSKLISGHIKASGASFLEAPVSGSKKPAEDGISYCSMMATFSEGLLLSEKVGLDPNVLVEVVSQGAISAPMHALKGPSMVKSLYPTAFPLKHQQKDMRLALGLAESVSQPTPIAASANDYTRLQKLTALVIVIFQQ